MAITPSTPIRPQQPDATTREQSAATNMYCTPMPNHSMCSYHHPLNVDTMVPSQDRRLRRTVAVIIHHEAVLPAAQARPNHGLVFPASQTQPTGDTAKTMQSAPPL